MRLYIDNKPVDAPDGATILEAAAAAGIEIPSLCYLPGCDASTSCFVCAVKVDDQEHLLPACATKAREGMRVESDSPPVRQARRTALELLLSDHVGDCVAPCRLACPAGLDAPRMLDQLARGDEAAARETILQSLPLPAVLGHICPAPCQKACRRGKLDSHVEIRQLHTIAGLAMTEGTRGTVPLDGTVPDYEGTKGSVPLNGTVPDFDRSVRQRSSGQPACRTGRSQTAGQSPIAEARRVVIVGAGPAGLAAAWFLAREGIACTILEKASAAGGGLRQIEAGRLPSGVLEADAARILQHVDIRPGVAIGDDVTLGQLRNQFDAVLLACGSVDAQQAQQWGLQHAQGRLTVDRYTMQTSMPGVFAAGAAAGAGVRLAVRAVADARKAATSIVRRIAQRTDEGQSIGQADVPPSQPRPGDFCCHAGNLLPAELREMADSASDLIPAPQGSVASMASQCLKCDCLKAGADAAGLHLCKLRRYAQEYSATAGHQGPRRAFHRLLHPQVIYESGKCILCGLCIQAARQEGEKYGLTFVGRGFDVQVAVPLGRGLEEGLTRAAGRCAEVCPTGAIVLRRS